MLPVSCFDKALMSFTRDSCTLHRGSICFISCAAVTSIRTSHDCLEAWIPQVRRTTLLISLTHIHRRSKSQKLEAHTLFNRRKPAKKQKELKRVIEDQLKSLASTIQGLSLRVMRDRHVAA